MATIPQIRAARGLLGWSQERLAEATGLSRITVARAETIDVSTDTSDAIEKALEAAGVEFTNGDQPGVRTKRPASGGPDLSLAMISTLQTTTEAAGVTTNPDYDHRRLMAAIKAIADGRRLDDFTSVPSDYGREFKIRVALIDGEREFPELFEDDDDWKVVLAAFAQLRLEPPSRRKDECCTSLLTALGRASG